MSSGRVLFVGCGPGAPDLLTLRAVRALESADVVIWSASLLDRDALGAFMRPDAELLAWPPATEQDIHALYDRAAVEDLTVVRCKGGDPMLFGESHPELAAVRQRGLGCEVVPGVSAVGATAAALQREIANADVPLLLAEAGALAGLADRRQVIAVHGAGRDPEALQRDLLALGLSPATSCEVAIEVSRRSETVVSCPLDELAETVRDTALGVLTIVLVMPPTTVQSKAPGR